MPQLMPLLWMISVFMVCLIIFMLVDIYYFKSFSFKKVFHLNTNFVIIYLW